MSSTKMILGYWGIRGLCAPIRYVLEYVGQEYDFKNYLDKHDKSTNQMWKDEKTNLGLEFPNLPYLIDGETKLTQSMAILRYLGRKYGLVATEEKDIQLQEALDGLLTDLIAGRFGIIMLCFTAQNWDTDKHKFLTDRLQPGLKQIEMQMINKPFLIGTKVTYTDFVLFELLEMTLRIYGAGVLKDFPNLTELHQRIKSLNGVKDFLASGRNPTKFLSPVAKWSG